MEEYNKEPKKIEENETRDYERKTNFELMKTKFLKNKFAVVGGIVVILFYLIMVVFPGFFATQSYTKVNEDYIYAPPQTPNFVDQEGDFHLRPFVYGMDAELNPETFTWDYKPNGEKHFIEFLTRGDEYKLMGLFETDLHLFGLEDEDIPFYLFGSDRMGRDLYSRILIGGRVSLTVGLIGVLLTIIIGSVFGTLSGYLGGRIDNIIQRISEVLMSFPAIPLWAALAAALPSDWSPIQVFFSISVILSLKNWTGLARQLRAKVMAYREEEFILAAESSGGSTWYIIRRHMIPNTLSHIIVVATLSIPGMILSETSLSFLGLGIQPPMTSWGTLLQAAQKVDVVLQHKWLLIPGIFIIIAVLSFNFLGDGVRDAADPFSS